MGVKIAFTGTGYIAQIHARAVQNLPGIEPVAVVNHRPDSMATFAAEFGIPRRYATVEALLRDGGVDALSVNTPNYLHASQTIAALEAGVPVMVEKPMAMNAEEAGAMMAASERTGALLMVAHCWRFDPEVLWLREQVTAGRLGRIVRTKGYGVHVRWGPSGWFTQQRYAGGGAIADVGIHALDTARFLLGDPQPVSVYARIGTHYTPTGTDYDVDDTGIIIVNWNNDASSYLEAGWWQPHADGPLASTQIYGTRGFGQVFPTYLDLMSEDRTASRRIESGFSLRREPHTPQRLYDTQMAYFLDCVRSGQTPKPGGWEGWVNMRVVDAAYESARTGQMIAL
ncbi:MAG TPA: Gfo/Idh/MocA family oxidoreductase [Chloroflexi bacterium]|nr:Gfo/Idh/MocA family oxidoreductase [Chloroflexota bacterium]